MTLHIWHLTSVLLAVANWHMVRICTSVQSSKYLLGLWKGFTEHKGFLLIKCSPPSANFIWHLQLWLTQHHSVVPVNYVCHPLFIIDWEHSGRATALKNTTAGDDKRCCSALLPIILLLLIQSSLRWWTPLPPPLQPPPPPPQCLLRPVAPSFVRHAAL